ncbi:MAG TPA: hypothetical protein VFW65_03135 [Pseudonocardiaceae bacterium]|nr:hypothetical protein [Pseudonocardiaceae bacterium]
MSIRVNTAMSPEGFSTGTDGRPVLLHMPDLVPGGSYGHAEFAAQCDAVVVGRTSFEPAQGPPNWPWPGQRVLVLTSRPVTAPEGTDVVACTGPAELVAAPADSGLSGDVHVSGGPSTFRAEFETSATPWNAEPATR